MFSDPRYSWSGLILRAALCPLNDLRANEHPPSHASYSICSNHLQTFLRFATTQFPFDIFSKSQLMDHNNICTNINNILQIVRSSADRSSSPPHRDSLRLLSDRKPGPDLTPDSQVSEDSASSLLSSLQGTHRRRITKSRGIGIKTSGIGLKSIFST